VSQQAGGRGQVRVDCVASDALVYKYIPAPCTHWTRERARAIVT
jgi:hypothetical protein